MRRQIGYERTGNNYCTLRPDKVLERTVYVVQGLAHITTSHLRLSIESYKNHKLDNLILDPSYNECSDIILDLLGSLESHALFIVIGSKCVLGTNTGFFLKIRIRMLFLIV